VKAKEEKIRKQKDKKHASGPGFEILTPGEALATLVQNPWTNIGPAPMDGGQIGQTATTRDMSGRIADVAVDPNNTDHWLVAGAFGGIWETTNGSNASTVWAPRTDSQPSLAMGAIAFALSDPSIVYAGTGEASFTCDSYFGAGLLKSTNGGTDWQPIESTPSFEGVTFSDIKTNPANSSNLLAATASGISGKSCESPPYTTSGSRGIFESGDAGQNWVSRQAGSASDLEVNPTNFNNQYAGFFGDGVYRSTNGGDGWTKLTTALVPTSEWNTLVGGIGRVELAIAPSNGNVLYVSIQDRDDSPDDVGNDLGLLGLWKTENAWDMEPTFTRINTGPTDDGSGTYGYCGWNIAYSQAGKQCHYDHEIIVDPANANILYAGGVPLWRYNGTTGVWTEISRTTNAVASTGIHVDQHAMAWVGTTRLIVGNDGGVWSTTNASSTGATKCRAWLREST